MLKELLDISAVYAVLLSSTSFEKYIKVFVSENSESMKTLLILLAAVCKKYRTTEAGLKRLSLRSYEENDEDVMVEFGDERDTSLYQFICSALPLMIESVALSPETEPALQATQFGAGAPLGCLRLRFLEFLKETVAAFSRDFHLLLRDLGLFGALLRLLERHPFHNALHLVVCDIFTHVLDTHDDELMEHLLWDTSLVRLLMDLSGQKIICSVSGQAIGIGGGAVAKRLASKLQKVSSQADALRDFLESTEGWQAFYD